MCAGGGLVVRATRSPIADDADDRAQKRTPKPPSAEASFLTSRTPCLGSSISIGRMMDRTPQTGSDVSTSLWTPTRPEVKNWLGQIKSQGMYFCDVTTKIGTNRTPGFPRAGIVWLLRADELNCWRFQTAGPSRRRMLGVSCLGLRVIGGSAREALNRLNPPLLRPITERHRGAESASPRIPAQRNLQRHSQRRRINLQPAA